MLGSCLVLLICSCAATAAPATDAPGTKNETINIFIDQVLAKVQIIMLQSGYDPVALPNETFNFGSNDQGVVGLYNGWMRGMSGIYRYGDMELLEEDGILNGINGIFEVGNLKGHYNGVAQYATWGPLIDVVITNSGGRLASYSKLNHQTCRFECIKFDLMDIGIYYVDISGLGPLNWMAEIMMTSVINVVSPFVNMIMETVVKDILNRVFSLIDLSPVGDYVGCVPQPNSIPTNFGQLI